MKTGFGIWLLFYELVQDVRQGANSVWVAPVGEIELGPGLRLLGGPFRAGVGQVLIESAADNSLNLAHRQVIQLHGGAHRVEAPCILHTGTELVEVASQARPIGVTAYSARNKGLGVGLAPLAGFEPAELPLPGTERIAGMARKELDYRIQWGLDELGAYGVLSLSSGAVTARFRWLEPGTFWMGSEEGDAEGYEDERPRHLVTISKGFWMAETACTQMLWQAVMGGNPSRFDDDSLNPVENVSWVEVRSFISELNRQIPDLNADLPTEAEWEYGCLSLIHI